MLVIRHINKINTPIGDFYKHLYHQKEGNFYTFLPFDLKILFQQHLAFFSLKHDKYLVS